jgi:peptidoglycan/LPS O-acetylase OafA/YrhL
MVDPAPRPKLHALQSLRGIAAIIVVLRHASLCYPDSNPVTGLVAAILLNSHAAVVVFFVLSGFVLGMSLADEDIDAACMARFYIRRGFRILPVLVFITLATLAYTLSGLSSAPAPGATPMLTNNIPHGWPGGKVLLLALISMNSHYAPQNWTVMVELIMALIFPLVFGAARRGGAGWHRCSPSPRRRASSHPMTGTGCRWSMPWIFAPGSAPISAGRGGPATRRMFRLS